MSEEKNNQHEWQLVERHEGGDTYRLRTVHGWIYRSREVGLNDTPCVALVFVPA